MTTNTGSIFWIKFRPATCHEGVCRFCQWLFDDESVDVSILHKAACHRGVSPGCAIGDHKACVSALLTYTVDAFDYGWTAVSHPYPQAIVAGGALKLFVDNEAVICAQTLQRRFMEQLMILSQPWCSIVGDELNSKHYMVSNHQLSNYVFV